MGVRSSNFQALMERAGAPCEQYPVFASREDFDCFYALKPARFHLDAWQLGPAYEELQKAEDHNWADNRLYCQEWLLLHCRLQFRTYQCDHQLNYNTLLEALRITVPRTELSEMESLLDKKDVLWHQQYSVIKASMGLSERDNVSTYLEALHLTLPNFDIHRLHQYRLSWIEITCLNNLAHEYRLTRDSHLCPLYYAQSLGECSRPEDAALAGTLACNLEVLTEYYKNASALKEYLYEDFGISLND